MVDNLFKKLNRKMLVAPILFYFLPKHWYSTGVLNVGVVDLHEWAWGTGVLKPPKLFGKCVYLHI